MDLGAVERRMGRLEAVRRELALEVVLWGEGQDPLLYLERRELLDALRDAISGVEEARVRLARAVLRIRDAGPARGEK